MGAALEVVRTVKNILLGMSPRVAGERHYGVVSFTPEELTAAIAAGVPDARIEQITVQRESTGTTDRARLLLKWNDAGRAAGLPGTAFAKGTPSHVSTRILNSAFGLCESEVRFYTELQPAVVDVSLTPYVARMRSGGRFAIALETLGPDDATFFDTGDTVPLAHAEAMMAALAETARRILAIAAL